MKRETTKIDSSQHKRKKRRFIRRSMRTVILLGYCDARSKEVQLRLTLTSFALLGQLERASQWNLKITFRTGDDFHQPLHLLLNLRNVKRL